jgi:hypothetical protein
MATPNQPADGDEIAWVADLFIYEDVAMMETTESSDGDSSISSAQTFGSQEHSLESFSDTGIEPLSVANLSAFNSESVDAESADAESADAESVDVESADAESADIESMETSGMRQSVCMTSIIFLSWRCWILIYFK